MTTALPSTCRAATSIGSPQGTTHGWSATTPPWSSSSRAPPPTPRPDHGERAEGTRTLDGPGPFGCLGGGEPSACLSPVEHGDPDRQGGDGVAAEEDRVLHSGESQGHRF